MTGLSNIGDLGVPRWYRFPKHTVVTLSSCSGAFYSLDSFFQNPPNIITPKKQTVQAGEAFADTAFQLGFEIVKS
jgi:hypothetical protein